MTTLRVLAAALVLVGGCSEVTEAQTSRSPTAIPRVFGAVGLETLTNDAPTTPAPGSTTFELERVPVSTAIRIEGGAAITSRLGAGIEFVIPQTHDFATRAIVGRFATHRRERLVLGVVRGRLVAARLIAVDVFGGIGAIFQDYELRTESCLRPVCDVVREERLHDASRAIVVGVEAPFQIVNHVNHVWVIPELRFYHARAPRLTNGGRWRSADRRAIGISARAGW